MTGTQQPSEGLHRCAQAHPSYPDRLPASSLIYVGKREGVHFAVCPNQNVHNQWYWREPVTPLPADDAKAIAWVRTLTKLPSEGFYTLPETLTFEGGGRWLKGAIVQLGYSSEGKGILFVAERRSPAQTNALFFSTKGKLIQDELLWRLRWAPILPVVDGESKRGPVLH